MEIPEKGIISTILTQGAGVGTRSGAGAPASCNDLIGTQHQAVRNLACLSRTGQIEPG